MTARIVIGLLLASSITATAQKYVAEKSMISFYSHAAIEDISAKNTKAQAIFDASSGQIAYVVPIKEFTFAKSLMQQHFNEKYMESEKYPRGTFEGKIEGYDASASATQNVRATGKLTIHGQTRDINVPGTIERQGDKLLVKSKFVVVLEDYNVSRPQLLWQNIAEQVEVTVDFVFKPE